MQFQPLSGDTEMEFGSYPYTEGFDEKYGHLENVTQNFSLYLGGTWENSIWENVMEDFKQSQFTLNEPTTIVLLVLYVPIFLTSLVGNILVLRVIVPNQRMWTVTNNFLVNLAIADLFVTVLCMPMTMLGKVYKLWIYGEVMCKLTPYLQGVSVTSSTFTITAMSLDRCLAILHPVKFRNVRTKRNVRTLLAVIWLTSALLMIPLLIVNKTKSQEIFTNFMLISCTEAWDSVVQRRAYDFSLLFIVCLGPAQIVFVSYVLMGKRLWSTDSRLEAHCESKKVRGRRSRTGSEKGSFNAIRASRRKTAKMCIVVSIVFVMCWLPYYTVNIYLDFKRDQDALDIVYWGLLIGHLHCITNPILYCFMHKTFRYCVKRMLPCWRNSFIRQPSCYGTNGFGGRTGSMMMSTRSQRSSVYRSSTNKHGRLSSTSSTASSSSQYASNNSNTDNDDQIVINYNTSNNGVNPKKVKMIFKRLRHKHLCKNNSFNNVKSLEIPDSIIEEVKSVTISNET